MTRRSFATVLGSLFITFAVAVNAPAVNANTPFTGSPPLRCEEFVTTSDGTMCIGVVPVAPMHLLAAMGVGQEHFEAMSVTQPDRFRIVSDTAMSTDS